MPCFLQVLIPFVNSFLILDSDGDRVIAKYYDGKPKAEQAKLESLLHKKNKSMTFRSDGL
jgi:hypothetical protein